MKTDIKRYSDLVLIESFEDRFEYLKCFGRVGHETFGTRRYLNQILYHTQEWIQFRRIIIIRDNGMDLGHPEVPIIGFIYIHHINPITVEDILNRSYSVFDPENVISTSFQTHQAIHYSKDCPIRTEPINRFPNDTVPWRN